MKQGFMVWMNQITDNGSHLDTHLANKDAILTTLKYII